MTYNLCFTRLVMQTLESFIVPCIFIAVNALAPRCDVGFQLESSVGKGNPCARRLVLLGEVIFVFLNHAARKGVTQ